MGLFQALSRVVDGCEAQILEGAFTAGHLWMAALGDLIIGIVVAAVQREIQLRSRPPC